MAKIFSNQRSSWLCGMLLGLAAFMLPWFVAAPSGLSLQAWHVTGLVFWMVIWWICQTVPLAITALLPLIVLPLLGIASFRQAATSYAHPIVFLLMGGFILGLAIQQAQLHKRLVLHVLRVLGDKPRWHMAGFMLVTACMSMWISNTTTTILMLPIATAIIQLHNHSDYGFSKAMLLALMCSANIGGMGTIIGTPPNAFLVGFLQQDLHITIGFLQWSAVAIPIVCVLLICTWLWLSLFKFRFSNQPVANFQSTMSSQLQQLGGMSKQEKYITVIFIMTALLWMFRPVLNDWLHASMLSDAGIAMAMVLVLFITPINIKKKHFLMDWHTAKNIPWDVLLLFGGGLSLSAAIKSTGLAVWLADHMQLLQHVPVFWQIMAIVLMIIILTEVNSNTATTATFVPLLVALALKLHIPVETLAMPAVLAASCAFMLPMATPPNAIVFSSGQVQIKDMLLSGVMLNIICWLVISSACFYIIPWVFH